MMQIQQQSIRIPKNGSDYAIYAQHEANGHVIQLMCVMDTIGAASAGGCRKFARKLEKRIQSIVQDNTISTLSHLSAQVQELIIELNPNVQSLHRARKKTLSGFCATFALVYDDQLLVHWLGDCRAYVFRAPIGYGPAHAPSVRCLTEDHNRLYQTIREAGEFTFLQNELQELSRTLICYWGTAKTDQVRDLLTEQGQRESTFLQRGDLLFIVTDGVYLPLVRERLAYLNYQMTSEDFTLTERLSMYARDGDHYNRRGECNWEPLVETILMASQKFTIRKKRYRDDIAAIAVYVDKV